MKHRKKDKKRPDGNCPLCDEPYSNERIFTKHHIFPKYWYGAGPRIQVCEICHKEFNTLNPMGKNPWTKLQCLKRWIRFCFSKGKDALEKYVVVEKLLRELEV